MQELLYIATCVLLLQFLVAARRSEDSYLRNVCGAIHART